MPSKTELPKIIYMRCRPTSKKSRNSHAKPDSSTTKNETTRRVDHHGGTIVQEGVHTVGGTSASFSNAGIVARPDCSIACNAASTLTHTSSELVMSVERRAILVRFVTALNNS